MRKNLLITTLMLLFFNTLMAQNYKVESVLGGMGLVGEKVTTRAYKYFVGKQALYFIDPNTQKTIIEIDEQGIIKNRIQFPTFSKALNNETFNTITAMLVDKEDRFICYCSNNNTIYFFARDGKLINTIPNATSTYLNGGYYLYFGNDSKNNLYIGGREKVSVLDKNGKFLYNFGTKGTGDGEFSGDVTTMLFDGNDNVFVVNDKRVQQFNNQGKFVSKFSYKYYNDNDIIFDGKDTFYAIPDNFVFGNNFKIDALDKTGKITQTLKVGDGSSQNNLVGFMNNSLIFNGKNYNRYDLNGNFLNSMSKNPNDNGEISTFTDFQFDNNGNMWVMDWDKFQMYDSNNKFVKRFDKPSNGDNYDARPIIKVNTNGDFVYGNSADRTIYRANHATKIKNSIFTFIEPETISYLDIDSTKNEISVLMNSFLGQSFINIYDLNGKLKRNIFKKAGIKATTRDKSGNYYVLSETSSDRNYSILTLDENGKEISNFKTAINAFDNTPIGITLDEYGIIHLGVRDIYSGTGMAIYAFDKKGVLQTSKLNLADNSGNFTSNQSFLLKYQKGYLYFANVIGNEIFKIKYNPSGNALKDNAIAISDINKTIGDADFTLTPTSSSKSAFTYSLVSGDAVSLAADGKVKVLKAGIAKIKVSQVENTEYSAGEKIITINVLLLATQITAIAPITKTVSDVDFDMKPLSNSDGKFSFKVLSGDAVSISTLGTVKILKAGKATIQIDQAEGTKYQASNLTVDITVNKLTQTITFEKTPTQLPNNSTGISLVASSNSALPVTLKLISGPATLVGNVLKPTGGIGIVIVEASQAGNDKYDVATAVRQTIEVFLVLGNDFETDNVLVIYPNPTYDYLNIKSEKVFVNYQIMNIQGLNLSQGGVSKGIPIDVKNLNKGNYIIRLMDKNQEFYYSKFVVE
jgi:Secretion system C-terminal sorting domain